MLLAACDSLRTVEPPPDAGVDVGPVVWEVRESSTAPAARADSAMVYHSGASRVVLFGGYSELPTGDLDFRGDAWLWDGRSRPEVRGK
jgi:hypothetical protein